MISQCAGIAILLVTAIFGLFFVFPKSPVRRIGWSVSSKLGIMLADGSEVRISVNEENLTFRVGLNALSSIRVDKIGLKVGSRTLWSNWTPMELGGLEGHYLSFPKLDKGYYRATLYAYTPEGFSKSNKFSIEVS